MLGPREVENYCWAGARHHLDTSSPRRFLGQSRLSFPRRDVSLFFHQIRPVTGQPSITTIYDTIPLRYGRAHGRKWAYLKMMTTLSRRILTASDFARGCIARDLGVPPEKIDVLALPRDDELVARIGAERKDDRIEPIVLYVGRFATHKNLETLLLAFQKTNFFAGGGHLALVGGSESEVIRFSRKAGTIPRVHISGACSQSELERLYARASAVVLPSLEEGFGLPAWEAIMCGIPVCISDGGSLPEATMGLVDPFPARSTDAMATALDKAASEIGTDTPARRAEEIVRQAPTLESFADQVCRILHAAA